MEPHLFRIKPGGGSGESYSHEGEEFLHVLRGHFEIWLDAKEHYRLKPGDSLYFESSTPHRWKNPGRKETWLLWVNTPQHSDSQDQVPMKFHPLRVVTQSSIASALALSYFLLARKAGSSKRRISSQFTVASTRKTPSSRGPGRGNSVRQDRRCR